tara:strand:+ start:7351 stop:8352 length:1002 start_codon:yes stop_codon:yes gene_type:complete
MLPIVQSEMTALLENLRLLETLVTAPLGLHSDIKMLRQSLPVDGASDLDANELRQRRTEISKSIEDVSFMALKTIENISSSLTLLDSFKLDSGSKLSEGWISRAGKVLIRSKEKVTSKIRQLSVEKLKGLYVIIDPEVTGGRPIVEVAEAALTGGASAIQYRDKVNDKNLILQNSLDLQTLCSNHDALFIVNDYADIANLSNANGLHIGQNDLSVESSRLITTNDQIIGKSNNTIDEAITSQSEAPDYLAIGPIYPTSTMGKDKKRPVGIETIKEIKSRGIPVLIAIGGINTNNAMTVTKAGADSICVASSVTLSENPETAARELVSSLQTDK